MKKFLPTLLLMFFILFQDLPIEASDEILSLDKCITLALENHPSIASAESEVRAAAARTQQQASGLRPSLSGSASHSRRRDSDTSSTSVSVNQILSDGGKKKTAVDAAQLNYEAAGKDLARTRQDVIYNVTEAFFGVLQAQWNVIVGEETLDLYTQQLEKARAAYGAGTVARSDVTAAEVDLGNALVDLTRSRANLERSIAVLENEMGNPPLPSSYGLADPGISGEIVISLDEAMKEALANRPDFASSRLALQAAKANLSYQAKSMNPEFSGFAGYDWSHGNSGGEDEWRTGVSVSIPLYDGGLTSSRIEEAWADIEKTTSALTLSRQTILLEVKTAMLDIEEARENLKLTELLVRQARENLELATGRYRVGVGNSLEVSQAAENYSQAQKTRYNAIYQYHQASASLEAAMGRDLAPWTTEDKKVAQASVEVSEQ